MKKALFAIATFVFALGLQAQNTNVTETSKTTVTTTKDSDGSHQQVKQQNTQAVQDIKFKDTHGDPLNKETVQTPVQVTSITQVTNPDGSTRTVDVDRSSTYNMNGRPYTLALDPSGYTMTSPEMRKPAMLRKTSTNSYIYRTKDKTSIGYFDTDGNLVLETYDDKSDKVAVEKYMRSK